MLTLPLLGLPLLRVPLRPPLPSSPLEVPLLSLPLAPAPAEAGRNRLQHSSLCPRKASPAANENAPSEC